MTLSSVLRQGKLHTLFHDEFWKSDHDFQLMIHSNFLATMHGFRDNEVENMAGLAIRYKILRQHTVMSVEPCCEALWCSG